MEAVSFSPSDAGRISRSVKWTERRGGDTRGVEVAPWSEGGDISFGSVQSDFSSGTDINVKACDANGVEYDGADAFDVNIPTAWGTVDLGEATVAGAAETAVTCKVAEGAVLQYAYAADGEPYLIGTKPTQLVWDYRYDTTSHKLQVQVVFLFGTSVSTVSDWVDVRECAAVIVHQVQDTGAKMQYRAATVYVPEAGAFGDWTDLNDSVQKDISELDDCA